MKAQQMVFEVAEIFDTTGLAIVKRCEQLGIQLRVEGDQLKVKGKRETIAAWQPMIQRHKPEVIAALTGQSYVQLNDMVEAATLGADYAELTDSIIELCRVVGYSDAIKERMLAARHNLYPCLCAIACAYFKMQVELAIIDKYPICQAINRHET